MLQGWIIVTEPDFEQIAQDIKMAGRCRAFL
jgi:hypothetical protein